MKAILFDLGGVIMGKSSKGFLRDVAVEYDVDLDELLNAWAETRGMYLIGEVTEEEFWNNFIDKSPINEPVEILSKEMMERYNVFLYANEEVLKYIDEIRKKDDKIKMILASNRGREEAKREIEKYDLKEYFDQFIFSHEIKAAKPDKEFFQEMLKKINLNAKQCIFVDDKTENIEIAEKMGFVAVQYKDFNSFKKVMDKKIKPEEE